MGLPKILKKILPAQFVYQYELNTLHSQINSSMSMEEWLKHGKPLPPPDVVKRQKMLYYKKQYAPTAFIETGTFMGDTTFAMNKYFDQLHTVEFDEKLFQKATDRFKDLAHIRVWHGDGGKVLLDILKTLDKAVICLFWLDGHYSGSITGKAEANTSVLKELEAIYHHGNQHVILIDDARLFIGQNDYPTLSEVESFAKSFDADLNFSVTDDIICITPKHA